MVSVKEMVNELAAMPDGHPGVPGGERIACRFVVA
jgi:hypothetical protein